MNDLISRQAAIDAINNHFGFNIEEEYGSAVQEVINGLPSAEPKWIPVSEKLPDSEYGESDSVLVCFENETQDVLYFDGSNWCYPTGETYISVKHKNDWHNRVVAWMPLPEPYEQQENRCMDCKHYGKLSLDCGRCDDDCSMYEPEESE